MLLRHFVGDSGSLLSGTCNNGHLPPGVPQRAAAERSQGSRGEAHEALTASERTQSDEVRRRLETLAALDQVREQRQGGLTRTR